MSKQLLENFDNLKKIGNDFFKQKNYIKANQAFKQAIQQIEESEEQFNNLQSECGKIYLNLLTNTALCSIYLKKQQEYLAAIEACDKALRVDSDNLKALYRRALGNKQLGELKERDEKMEGVYEHYLQAKKDLERLCLLDRQNKAAMQKLDEVNKNVARLKVLNQIGVVEIKAPKVSTAKVERAPEKVSVKMENIMKQYKIDEVVKQAQEKTQQTLLNSDLPKTKSDLDKAIKQFSKKPELLKQFFLKFKEGYLQKLDPGFDVLFGIVTSLITVSLEGNIEQFAKIVTDITKTKSFGLLWKGLIESERKEVKSKLSCILENHPELASSFQ